MQYTAFKPILFWLEGPTPSVWHTGCRQGEVGLGEVDRKWWVERWGGEKGEKEQRIKEDMVKPKVNLLDSVVDIFFYIPLRAKIYLRRQAIAMHHINKIFLLLVAQCYFKH